MKLPTTLSYKDYYKLTNKMFLSNKYVALDTDLGLFTCWNEVDDFIYNSGKINDPDSKITITSIEVRLPQFSIGDTVMIVDTGEIIEYRERTSHFIQENNLVKIPTEFITLLQD